jgi:hypothetical protein
LNLPIIVISWFFLMVSTWRIWFPKTFKS